MITTAMFLLGLGTAGAAETVLCDGRDADDARARAAEALAVPADQLTVTTLGELLGERGLGLSGVGSVEACAAEATTWAPIEEAIAKGEGDMNYGRFDEAAADLDGAVAALACLGEAMDPVAGARLFFLRGVLHFQTGNNREAFVAFRQSILVRPELVWDDAYAPHLGKDLFDSARADLERQESSWFSVLPAVAASAVLVDGKALPEDMERVSLRAGPHLVQVGEVDRLAAWVTLVPGGETRLLAYTLLADEDVSWISHADERAELGRLLGEALGSRTTLTAVVGRSVWRGEAGGTGWERLAKTSRREAIGSALTWGGSAALAGGAAWAVVSWSSGRSAISACEDGGYGDCADNEDKYDSAAQMLPIAKGVAIGGAALLGTGLLLDGRAAFAPIFLDGGGGLQVAFRGRR